MSRKRLVKIMAGILAVAILILIGIVALKGTDSEEPASTGNEAYEETEDGQEDNNSADLEEDAPEENTSEENVSEENKTEKKSWWERIFGAKDSDDSKDDSEGKKSWWDKLFGKDESDEEKDESKDNSKTESEDKKGEEEKDSSGDTLVGDDDSDKNNQEEDGQKEDGQKEDNKNDSSSEDTDIEKAPEPIKPEDIKNKADGTYEEWLASAMMIGISMSYPDSKIGDIYYMSETEMNNKSGSQGVVISITEKGKTKYVVSKPVDGEIKEKGKNTLYSQDIEYASFEEVKLDKVELEKYKNLNKEDLEEFIKQSLLVSVYEN